MKMRTRILGRMLNSEVQQYLERNDIIIVPVGTTEMHGGMPLDCETVVSEAIGLKMAEACDALLLTGLPYFYYMLPSVCGENLNYDEKKDDYVRYPFAYMLKRPVFTREGRRIRKKEGR